MNAQQMWAHYAERENITARYDAWAFGDDPDKLAQLVLSGEKTGTSSAYIWYGLENEALPKEGEYNLILNSREEAVCITKTTRVYITPFDRVTEDHARKEGEGDKSLDYWRKVHEAFFTQELEEVGLSFRKSMEIVCEEFVRVYP